MKEIREILASLPIEVMSMEEAGMDVEVEETGTSFEENALFKADTVFRVWVGQGGLRAHGHMADERMANDLMASGQMPNDLMVLADDSGLEVDALDGAPGVFSARYGGPGLDDASRWQLLLKNLEGVDEIQRSARFVCAAALVSSNVRKVVRGTVEGCILTEPRGDNGFGYDPVFLVEKTGKSAAELDTSEKNRISHRARALDKVLKILSGE